MKARPGKAAPAPQTEPEADRLPKSTIREYVDTIVICVLVLIFARHFVFAQSKIPTGSMINTLLVGDYIFVNHMVYAAPGDTPRAWLGQREIRRGDVVVFRFPQNTETDYVKRVVGLPGDTILVRGGRVLLNGQPTQEPFIRLDDASPTMRDFGPITVPPGNLFCMGDNRDHSSDGRFWGFVPRSLVKGQAFLIWFSYEEQPNDHLNTGFKRIGSIFRKLLHPGGIRFSRFFSRVK